VSSAAARQPFSRRIGAVMMALGAVMTVLASPAAAETLEERAALLAPHFTLTRPEGEGPFPVVVMLHGCGGPRPFLSEAAEVAVASGAAALIVDSYAPRGISRVSALATVCTGARLRGRERAGDLFAAFAWARKQAWADHDRLAAMGWSHGAWTIMDALALRAGGEMERATRLTSLPAEPLEGLAAAMIVYPYAGVASYAGRRPWRIAAPSTAIVAGRDYIVGTSTPRAALERLRARGARLDIVLFEDATHAFEDPYAQDPRVRFNPEATAREHDMLRAMIARL
jgi:dienelactone hydrolase